ncbi:DUF945 family protein [Cocleimonas flava]|uniref:Uncharacterized protein DUF945 n=1 Tax=Cocleimonas flava TaxID=634765 RepID=A0A4R1EUV9_9GAMM|nr:DUF945 family protein [Cocleimonas flava]TCJ84450.1 uncharacterized protein DUF945 [Cocleimonas flava]
MRKLLSILVMICLSTFLLWAVMSWYLGVQAEKDFRQVLEIQTDKLGEKPFRLELLDYKKHLLGSSASVRVSSDIPLLDDWLGDFVLTLKSLNGPLFITKKGVDYGVSRWFIRIDPESFSAESKENIQNIFPNDLPTGVVIIGFDKESSFESSFNAEWLDAKLTAIYNLSTLSYRGSLELSRLDYASPIIQLSADNGLMNFQYPNKLSDSNGNDTNNPSIKTSTESVDAGVSYKNASIQIPQLRINSQRLSESILTGFKGHSQITFKDDVIDTFLTLNFTRLNKTSTENSDDLPIDQLQITAQSSGIQQATFLQVMESKAELDNLQMQTQWELQENGELPEGQDKIWQLQNQIHRLQQQYPVSFYKALFSSRDELNMNNPSIEIKASNPSGVSTLIGHLKPSENSGESTRFSYLLEAESKVTLDDLLYAYISKRTAIRKKQFSLLYKQNKLLMQ